MNIPDNKMHIVPIGIDSELYKYSEPVQDPQSIGYISRMYEEHGFGLMIDAYIKLKQNQTVTVISVIDAGTLEVESK